jgi:hypothetical protein
VRKLGAEATEIFLDELSPHLAAVQLRQKGGDEGLVTFLHSWAVSSVVMLEAGGLDEFRRKVQNDGSIPAPTKSAQEVQTELDRLS